VIFIFVKILIFASKQNSPPRTTRKKKRQNTMPKARKSTRNSDAMDAEGHEEVRDVFVVFTTSSRFFIFFFESVCIFLRAVVGRSQFVQFIQFNF